MWLHIVIFYMSLRCRTRALKYQKFCLTTFWYHKQTVDNRTFIIGRHCFWRTNHSNSPQTAQSRQRAQNHFYSDQVHHLSVPPWGDQLKQDSVVFMMTWTPDPNQIFCQTPDWDPNQQEPNVCWLSFRRVYHMATFNLLILVYVKAGHSWTQSLLCGISTLWLLVRTDCALTDR